MKEQVISVTDYESFETLVAPDIPPTTEQAVQPDTTAEVVCNGSKPSATQDTAPGEQPRHYPRNRIAEDGLVLAFPRDQQETTPKREPSKLDRAMEEIIAARAAALAARQAHRSDRYSNHSKIFKGY